MSFNTHFDHVQPMYTIKSCKLKGLFFSVGDKLNELT